MKIIYLILLIISIGLISCEKDTVGTNSSNNIKSIIPVPSNTAPSLIDGMLFFSDTVQFNKYYTFLDESCEQYEENLDYFDLDSTLSDYESTFEGFNSLRQWYYDETDECIDPMEIMKSDFIHDDILKSILNQNYEVCIGGDVYVFMNAYDIYKISDGNASLVGALRNIEKGTAAVLCEVLKYPKAELISTKHNLKRTIVADADNYYTAIMDISNIDCETNAKSLFCVLSPNGNVDIDGWDVEWTIDYGDGSTIISSTDMRFDEEHIYADGSYTATISVKYLDPNNTMVYIEDYKTFKIETDIACSSVYSIDADKAYSNDGQYMISAVLYYKVGSGVFFASSRIKAKTFAWKWKASRAKWKRKRYDNYVKLYYNLRNSDCESIDNDSKEKKFKKRKRRRVSRFAFNKQVNFSNGENYSHHEVKFPTGTLTLDLIVEPCSI